MAKADLIDALIESAILHFARDGYEGASLRTIAGDVGANLGSIDRYFGSKPDLFRAVLRKVWDEVEKDRERILQQAAARNGGDTFLLSDLVHALARPIVERALSARPEDVARTELFRMVRNARSNEAWWKSADIVESSVRALGRWIDGMAARCPELSREDIVWVFSYVSGLIFSRQLIQHQYDVLFEQQQSHPSVDEVTDDIVAFSCAGIEAIIERPTGGRRSMCLAC